jgi:hypothetical protein
MEPRNLNSFENNRIDKTHHILNTSYRYIDTRSKLGRFCDTRYRLHLLEAFSGVRIDKKTKKGSRKHENIGIQKETSFIITSTSFGIKRPKVMYTIYIN